MFGTDEVSDGLIRRRLYFIVVIMAVAFGALIVRLGHLQIVCTTEYKKRSEKNRIRPLRLAPPRGVVYDRQGNMPLIDNETAFDVCVAPSNVERLEYMDTRAREIFQRLNFTPEEYESVLKNLRELRKSRTAAFDPVVIKEDIDKNAAAYLAENNSHIPEMIIRARAKRRYRGMAAHVLGYTSMVNEDEVKEKGYEPNDMIGRNGIEAVYEEHLRGDLGWKMAEVDVYGRIVRDLPLEVKAEPGQSLNLTLDAVLQKQAETLLEDKVGTIIAIDPRNGDILAMASKPDYSANTLKADWGEIIEDTDKPFMNRAIMRMYPPGSTFKIISATAALEEGKVDGSVRKYCNGRLRMWGRAYKCHKKTGHGSMDIHKAIVESCNVFFYNMAYRRGLTVELMHKYAMMFGLGQKVGINLPGECHGSVPKFDKRPGDKVNMCIGQGDLLVTPLQLANIICVMANRGVSYKPRLVRQPNNLRPEIHTDLRGKVSLRTIDTVRNALKGVVERGYSKQANLPDYHTAGKTGTAQNPHGDDHALFIGFGPFDNPEIAVAVVVENVGLGSENAAPIAGQMFSAHFYRGQSTLAKKGD